MKMQENTSQMDLKPGEHVDKYTLHQLLGRGGMGDVWAAEHPALGQTVALKVISPTRWIAHNERDTLTQRFTREAQATCQLTSPHTIRVHDFGTTDNGTFFYAMELLEGLDLRRLVELHGPVPVERAIALLQQACDSLGEAHRGGLVHRDVKPANLFATRAGMKHDFVKVLDFGLVKSIDDRLGDVQLTAVGTTAGSPAYMAPEVNQGGAIDHRADIYALGCVAHWLVTGELVFQSPNAMKAMLSHANEVPAPPSSMTELTIPPAYDALVARCLSKDPADRPGSTAAVADLLRAIPIAEAWTQTRAAAWWKHRIEAPKPVSQPHRTDA
ncbi:MAG: serine/threonine protein kinase, partial [Myxococcota bacterium]